MESANHKIMKKLLSISLLLFFSIASFSQKRKLDESNYDTWKNIESFNIADDATYFTTLYKGHTQANELVIENRKKGYRKIFRGTSVPKPFNDGKNVFFTIKDTLFLFDAGSGFTSKIAGVSKPFASNNSPFVLYKSRTLTVVDASNPSWKHSIADSSFIIEKSLFTGKDVLILLGRLNDNENRYRHAFFEVLLNGQNPPVVKEIFSTHRTIRDFDYSVALGEIIFLCSSDSLGSKDVAIYSLKKERSGGYLLVEKGPEESMLPVGMVINFKKGIKFSEKGDYVQFETSLLNEEPKTVVKDKGFPQTLELWRWNDTLLPSQKRGSGSVFSNSFKWIYYPEHKRLVRLSYGRGVYLEGTEDSPFGFELDRRPYQYEEHWRDPLPRDFYITNMINGENKLLFKAFQGTFAPSATTPFLFVYKFEDSLWYSVNLHTGETNNLSALVPFTLTDESFDKPQPPGSYGQAGVTKGKDHFIVYDRYDIWAIPISGEGKAICLTNGYGRKNGIRFKVLKRSGRGVSAEVDINAPFLVESTDLKNRDEGFYMAAKGKDPRKLLSGPYKYSYQKSLKNGEHLLKRESFGEAPDYWVYSKDFKSGERLTVLNEQLEGLRTGTSEVIWWRDSSGREQSGVLFKPEGYNPSQRYPVIVHLYETKSENTNLFYTPEPTSSEINPLMYTSKGYVVFMPDIRYIIGWPGQSALNIVESGTRQLVESGIADPEKIGIQGHSWGGYQVAYIITQSKLFRCACTETAVANMTSAYSGLRAGAGKPRMFMYESTQSRIGGTIWEMPVNYIKNSPLFYLDRVTTPLLSRHCDADEAVPYSQGLELFLGLKRLNKPVWMFNYKGEGHNIKKRDISVDWNMRMSEFFDFYLLDSRKPDWMDANNQEMGRGR